APAILGGADLGTVDLEVDELLRIDRTCRPGGPDLVQMLDHPGGCLAGIVPSAESRDGDSTHHPIIGSGTRAILGLPGDPDPAEETEDDEPHGAPRAAATAARQPRHPPHRAAVRRADVPLAG